MTTLTFSAEHVEIWFGVKQTENGETSTGYTQKWKEIIELYRRNQWWDKEEVCKDGGAWGRVPVPAGLLWHGALKEDNHPGESLRSLWWWLIGKVKMIMISRRIMWEVEDNQDFFLSLELFVQLESSTGDWIKQQKWSFWPFLGMVANGRKWSPRDSKVQGGPQGWLRWVRTKSIIFKSFSGIVYFISQWAHWMVSVLTFSFDGECVDFFHHIMKELTFHNVVKVQSSCCLCPFAVAQKSLTHDVPSCL